MTRRNRRPEVPQFRVLIEASKLLMTEEDGSVSAGGFHQMLWVDAADEGEARRRAMDHMARALVIEPGFIRNPAQAVVTVEEIDPEDDPHDDLDATGRVYHPAED
jgi:hypothetical protein